jgi:hypothetical protein
MADFSELPPVERAKRYRALASDARRDSESAQGAFRKSYLMIAEQFERLALAAEAEIARARY